MAKAENVREDESLVGGFSFRAAKQAAQEESATKAASAQMQTGTKLTSQALVKDYQEANREEEEWRNVKLNLLLKPSLVKRLDKAARRKEIRSKNDLINYLLEQYFGIE